MTAVDRAAALLRLLVAAADDGGQCPGDADLAERLDCNEEQVGDAFAFLEAAGLIRWHRVVTIAAPVEPSASTRQAA